MIKIIIILLFTVQCIAEPSILNKGDISPYTGLLFTVEDANNIRRQLIDLDTTKAINDSLNKSLNLYKENDILNNNKVDLLMNQNDKLAKSLYQERSVTNWERVGFFVLGIAVTGLAIYGASQLAK